MKKMIFISAITLIILGCGSKYPEHNFVQSPTQPQRQKSIINISTRDYGSKSVEEIKRDLAQEQSKKPISNKSLATNILQPSPIKTLPLKRVVKKDLQQNDPSIAKENLIDFPSPQIKTIVPPIAAIKDFIDKQQVDKEQGSDKTVVTIQPSSTDRKPKAVLKITNARDKIIASGKKLIGTPYLFGGSTRSGFDCSGLVQYVYKQHGIHVPRTSLSQFLTLKSVKNPQPGDLVFFRHGNRPVNHVGIYVGNNKMLHAPSTGKRVKIVDLTTQYWKKRYAGARRVLDSNYLMK